MSEFLGVLRYMFYRWLEVPTINFLNIRTPKKLVVITLKFELWLYHRVMSPNDADGMANSVDPEEQSDLGLHCLPRHICPKT